MSCQVYEKRSGGPFLSKVKYVSSVNMTELKVKKYWKLTHVYDILIQ